MKSIYRENIIGYSDHTMPDSDMSVLSCAYLLGAKIIEKHFTHDKTLPGNDHYHAMDIIDLKIFKKKLKEFNYIIGDANYKEPIFSEDISRKNARRSLVINKDLKKGSKIKYDDLACKRPGNGISPVDIENVIGMKLKISLEADKLLLWEYLH